jgi:hypothetical protein
MLSTDPSSEFSRTSRGAECLIGHREFAARNQFPIALSANAITAAFMPDR